MRECFVVHSFLFAVFPIPALYPNNMGEVLLSELVIPLVVPLGEAPPRGGPTYVLGLRPVLNRYL